MDAALLRSSRERMLRHLAYLGDDVAAEMGKMIRDPNTPASAKVKLFDMVIGKIVVTAADDNTPSNSNLDGLPSLEASDEDKLLWLSKFRA